jgi:DNA mismatch endonuclease (patch repair protein)
LADVVDKATRSRMMSGIRGKDTTPEKAVRSALHKAGFRFRLHVRDLPGKPDIVLPKYRTAIFVHGCFWHGHECRNFKWPKTRADWWRKKIEANKARDRKARTALRKLGWNVRVVWECEATGTMSNAWIWTTSP